MISRNPQATADQARDLIIIGGGIYGVTLTLEAARRGLRPLLLEQGDFGQATSANSLRILHGGLRYLQSLDLRRHRTSVRERRWFVQNFSDLIDPLPCLMPLYSEGTRRPSVFRVALAIDDLLSKHRHDEVPTQLHLPPGRVLTRDKVRQRFAQVDTDGLTGGALWYDAVMRSPQRILCEMLRWACHCGARVLNYVQATRLISCGTNVTGLGAIDLATDQTLEFSAPVVVNCAGPWCGDVAIHLDREIDTLFRPSLAFNLLLDRHPLSDASLAVGTRKRGAASYFIVPWKDQTLAGTVHLASEPGATGPTPTDSQINRFLNELNTAVPGYNLSSDDVTRIYSGWLPAVQSGSSSPARTPQIVEHRNHGGPAGLFSVSGVKYTTARDVSEQTLRQVVRYLKQPLPAYLDGGRPKTKPLLDYDDPRELLSENTSELRSRLEQLIQEESVLQVGDIVLRRTNWSRDPQLGAEAARRIGSVLGWSSQECEAELSSPLVSRAKCPRPAEFLPGVRDDPGSE